MSEKMKPVMFADNTFGQAVHALFLESSKGRKDGHFPAYHKKYRVPMYSQAQIEALLKELEDILTDPRCNADVRLLRAAEIIKRERGNV